MGFTTDRFVVLALVASCSPSPPPLQTQHAPPPSRPRLVAHRGASHDYPENTLRAFHHAWDLGVEAVELDAHVSRDGYAVVIHDASTKRTGNRDRAVAAQTLAELRELDVGMGERIPTLADAVATLPPGRTLFVEIKTSAASAPAIARAIGSRAGIALQGFDPAALAALSAALPAAPAYWTVDPPVENDQPLPYPLAVVDEAKRRGFAGLALFHGSVSPAFLAAARDAGLLVDVWTVNDAGSLQEWMARDDVRWIETDRPDLVPVR